MTEWSKRFKMNSGEWRSITPEREFGQMAQTRQLTTEPNENKLTTKSISQEININGYSNHNNELNRLLIPSDQQQKFQKPLNHMQTSLKKISEIGQQINSILTKYKQNRVNRPQSDLNMFEKHSMMKKTSQNDISLSTNMNLNHSFIDNRGTETERSYFYQKYQKENQKFGKKDSLKDYQSILQATSQFQTNSLQKIIEKKIAITMQNQNSSLINSYQKQITKKDYPTKRAQNLQKFITSKLLRNSSDYQEKSIRKNNQMSSYYSQNHYSKSQSSFLVERENSKSENTTSRNNRIRVSSYIKTPTKNTSSDLVKQLSPRFISQPLSSYQVSSSKINSLLSSMNKDFDKISTNLNPTLQNVNVYHLQTFPIQIANDPNQTNIIVCCSDFSVKSINLYSGRISILGKHLRPINTITKIVILQNCKIFYTGSQDSQIIQWVSESMHGTYRQKLSWKLNEPPLQIFQTEKGILYVVTANNIIYNISTIKHTIPYKGVFKCLIQTQNNILIAINNIIYKIQADQLYKVFETQKLIKTMIYEEDLLYVLTQCGNLLIFEESKKLKFNSEIELGAINIFNMQNGQIIIQINKSEFIVYSQQISKSYSIDGEIKCLLALTQLILIGSNKKLIETIKI